MSLTEPKRKKRPRLKKLSPFPVPIQSITGLKAKVSNWSYYTGYLHGNIVAVRHTGDMDALFKMGFFGKGSLSRSQPLYNTRYKSVCLQTRTGSDSHPRVVNKEWYKTHLKWAGQEVIDSSEDEEEPITDKFTEKNSIDENKNQEQTMNDQSELSPSPNIMETENSWEENTDFWNSSAPRLKDTSETKTSTWEEDDDFWGTEPTKTNPDSWQDTKSSKNCEMVPNSPVKEEINLIDQGTKLVQAKCDVGTDHSDISPHKRLKSDNSPGEPEFENKKSPDSEISKNRTESETLECDVNDNTLHPLCQSSDHTGDIFVVPNTSYDKNMWKRKNKWKAVLKNDPFPIREYLQLSLVEAFFLSYGLGCFVLKDLQKSLDLTAMWQIFCSKQRNFIPSYIVYHYYRSKGWVPKSGLKFGCDFILYKVGPPFYHGSYSLIIQYVEEESLVPVKEFPQRKLSWRSLSGLNRITEHVGKEVLICYVIKPKNISEEELSSPCCIPRFKVKEMLLTRWISSQERQKKDLEEMP